MVSTHLVRTHLAPTGDSQGTRLAPPDQVEGLKSLDSRRASCNKRDDSFFPRPLSRTRQARSGGGGGGGYDVLSLRVALPLQGTFDSIGLFVNDPQEEAGITVGPSPALFPLLECMQRQTIAAGKG